MQFFKIKQFLTFHLKTIIIVIWAILTFIRLLLVADTGPTLGTKTTIDTSWIISLPHAFQQGYISGRDFQFTYGPLWQFLCWLVSFGNNSKTSFDDYGLVFLLFNFAGVPFLGLLVGLIKQITWKYALFFFAFISVLQASILTMSVKYILGLIICFLLSWSLNRPTNKARLISAGITGFCCFVGQLIILDLGIYALASCLGILLVYSLLPFFSKRVNKPDLLSSKIYMQMFGVLLGVFVAWNLILSIIFLLTSPNYSNLFLYQILSWETLKGYTYTMGWLEWGLSLSSTVILILLIIYTVVFTAYLWWKLPTNECYFLASALLFSLLSIRGATVRSDAGHILISLIPLMILLPLLGVDWLKKGRVSLHWCFALMFLLIAVPYSSFTSFTRLMTWMEGNSSLSVKWTTLTTRQTPPTNIVSTEMIAALDPARVTLSFPWDNYIPIGLNEKFIAPILQSYAAFTPTLQEAYVDQLERYKPSLQVIYGLDESIGRLEEVQQISRVPVIFEYLYRNFEAKYPKLFDKGFLILQPRSTPITLEGDVLAFNTKVSDKEFTLSTPATCSMVRLRVKINYPVTINLGRPAHLKLSFFDNKKLVASSYIVPIEPGKDFSTYFSIMDPGQFQNIFIKGKPVQTKQWDSLTLEPVTNAFLDIGPTSVVVGKLECLQFNTFQ